MLVLQKLIPKQMREIEEWNDLIIQNLPHREPQVLEIEGLADKKLEEARVLQQMLKQLIEE